MISSSSSLSRQESANFQLDPRKPQSIVSQAEYRRILDLLSGLHGSSDDEHTTLVAACRSDPEQARLICACVHHMAWLAEREEAPCCDVVDLSKLCDTADCLIALSWVHDRLANQLEAKVIALLDEANHKARTEAAGSHLLGAMTMLCAVASMLVAEDGRFDATALGAMIQAVGRYQADCLSDWSQEYIVRRLQQLKQQPPLAARIDKATEVSVHPHIRPLMLLNGEDFTEYSAPRSGIARILMVMMLKVPRQRDVGSCWLSADKQTIHAAHPALLARQLRHMLELASIRHQYSDGKGAHAFPPNVPVEQAPLLAHEISIDISDLDACISHRFLAVVFDAMLGSQQQMATRKMLLNAAAQWMPVDHRPGHSPTEHVARLDSWIKTIAMCMAGMQPQQLPMASLLAKQVLDRSRLAPQHRLQDETILESEEARSALATPQQQELLDRWRRFCRLQDRARMAIFSLTESPLLKAWELAYTKSASKSYLDRSWKSIRRAIVREPSLRSMDGWRDFIAALGEAFMQNAEYEYKVEDRLAPGKAIHRLFIRTENVAGGIEVTSERIFEHALCALIGDLRCPLTAVFSEFEACKRAVIRFVDDPATRFASERVMSAFRRRDGSYEDRPWRMGSANGTVTRLSVANPDVLLQRSAVINRFNHTPDRKAPDHVMQELRVKTDTGWHESVFGFKTLKKDFARGTLEHVIELMRWLMREDRQGTKDTLHADGALVFEAGHHTFRLLPDQFADAWNGASLRYSASRWITENIEEPARLLRKQRLPEDQAREKVNAILVGMSLRDPASQEEICNRVLDESRPAIIRQKGFKLGRVLDALAGQFNKKGIRQLTSARDVKACLRANTMRVLDRLGMFSVAYADSNFEIRVPGTTASSPRISAFAYDLLEDRMSHWRGLFKRQPNQAFTFFYVEPCTILQ